MEAAICTNCGKVERGFYEVNEYLCTECYEQQVTPCSEYTCKCSAIQYVDKDTCEWTTLRCTFCDDSECWEKRVAASEVEA